ncbi:MAG TPA: penicillin-binding protein 2 [Candidatus Omnitrophota bacterium]|nr:penicillin-binding protein 2 [Candidatus Omnitrophota bacterium]
MSIRIELSGIRQRILVFFVLLGYATILFQLFNLMWIYRDAHLKQAYRQHHLTLDIPPVRGVIRDRNGKDLVSNIKAPSIYAVPRILFDDDRKKVATKLAKILNIPRNTLDSKLARSKSFVWIKRKVNAEQAQEIKQIGSAALGIMEEYQRVYPYGEFLSQVIGFTNVDSEGIEGMEMHLDRYLRGVPGHKQTIRDAMGRQIKAFEKSYLPAIDGGQIELTIDQQVQHFTEKALDQAYRKWKAKAAFAIVMNPNTGEILAMANRPTYDPNEFKNSNAANRRNRVITDMYEPGSIFKIVAISGALDLGYVTPETTFYCENGKWAYGGGRILHDVHAYGKLSVVDIMAKSSNIGTVKIGLKMKPEEFQKYIDAFGFGKPTGVDFPGEARGFTRPPKNWSRTSPYNIPIGHEVLVTPLQMVRMLAVIANGGKLVKPYIIEKIEDSAGVAILKNKHEPPVQIIKPEVADEVRKMLVQVVERGTGQTAKINGFQVGGKTGTAQKVVGKTYSHDKFMSSFMGFAPAENPRYVMLVVLDEARPLYYGGTVAGPVFKEVMESVLRLDGFEIPEAKATDAAPISDEIVKDIAPH